MVYLNEQTNALQTVLTSTIFIIGANDSLHSFRSHNASSAVNSIILLQTVNETLDAENVRQNIMQRSVTAQQ